MVVKETDPRHVATSLQTFTETSNLVWNILVLVSMKELVPSIRLDTVFVSGPVPVLAAGVLFPRFVDDFLDCLAWGPRYWRSKHTDSGGKSVGNCHLRGTVPPGACIRIKNQRFHSLSSVSSHPDWWVRVSSSVWLW